jgi:hypothetical protein
MGMDWHSSGITTSVMGALKRGLASRADELGLYICGGRGRFSRNTPNELRSLSHRHGFNGEELVRTSRLTARIDNNAIADGFQIYLHSFVVARDGEWAVVQQGLNEHSGMARRYHWHSATVKDFISAPHTGIVGAHQGTIMNLVDSDAGTAQQAMLSLARERPEKVLREARAVNGTHASGVPLYRPGFDLEARQRRGHPAMRYLKMPRHHEVRAHEVDLKRLGAVLAIAYERDLHDFAELLLTEKLGPRTLQSLALVAEVIHGAPARFNDPARFSFAHGGKDGHPFPVPLKTYDESLNLLRTALDRARPRVPINAIHAESSSDPVEFGREKLEALRRLNRFARTVETKLKPRADFDALLAHEHAISPSLDGRTVMDDKPARNFYIGRTGQRSLF